jgi:cobalamin-dependent methionine synthase I
MGRIKTNKMAEKAAETKFKIIRFRTLNPESNFVNVGERTNVTGSRNFCVLLKKKNMLKLLL